MQFKVGDKVRLSEHGKQMWDDAPNNPHNGIGTVYEVRSPEQVACGKYPYKVEWSRATREVYNDGEIELAESTPRTEGTWLTVDETHSTECTCPRLFDANPIPSCPYHGGKAPSEREQERARLDKVFGILREEPRTRADVNRLFSTKGDLG